MQPVHGGLRQNATVPSDRTKVANCSWSVDNQKEAPEGRRITSGDQSIIATVASDNLTPKIRTEVATIRVGRQEMKGGDYCHVRAAGRPIPGGLSRSLSRTS